MLRSAGKRLGLATVLSLVVSGVALSGPPWIAVEYPVNPHDPNTRGAFMTVRTYHHGDLTAFDISGTAEGLVSGRRQSASPTPLGAELSPSSVSIYIWLQMY